MKYIKVASHSETLLKAHPKLTRSSREIYRTEQSLDLEAADLFAESIQYNISGGILFLVAGMCLLTLFFIKA